MDWGVASDEHGHGREATIGELEAANRELERSNASLAQANIELADLKYAIDEASIVAITDVKGVIAYVNDRFCKISKYERDELLGADHRILNSGYHPKEFMRNLWRTIGRGSVWRGEIRNRAKDGTFYWVDTTIVPLMDRTGKPRQYLAIRTDITERKRVESLLVQKETMAQLGTMAAVIAHEVKNPLAGISGAIQVISKRLPADSSEVRILGDIRERVLALNQSLTALLSFARPRVAQLRPVSTKEVVAHPMMVVTNDPRYEHVEVQLRGKDFTIVADPELLGQALLNLLINAVQANEERGTVVVEVGQRERHVTLSVSDQGPGLPEGVDVFQPFFTTKIAGTGLGLAVVRQTAEAHGGSVEIERLEGGGTRFSLVLPRPVGADEIAPAKAARKR
ncbi:MAG: PAS domain S-box protein [Deltaproteobacteria bacterium]|nr:PAS domain S-box protein [Deltaproteobacteria bacterium]